MIYRPSKPLSQSPGTPNHLYDSMLPLWTRSRAVLNGEQAVKQHDSILDTTNFTNLLVPFSDRMTAKQYSFYLAEAELPGLVSQYGRVVVGGLLRKPPTVEFFSPVIPEAAETWIRDSFTADRRSLIAFLDEALWEEVCTSRAFVMVDYPVVSNYDELTPEEKEQVSPYPVLWKAENVINWSTRKSAKTGMTTLDRVILSFFREELRDPTDFHPEIVEYAVEHKLDAEGYYCVSYYRRRSDQTLKVTNGQILPSQQRRNHKNQIVGGTLGSADDDWELFGDPVYPLIQGNKLDFIPGFFLNGSITPREPLLMSLVDREISLYNKMSRRNHLLYTASTFTPVFMTSISEDAFEDIIDNGLGSFVRLNEGDKVDALKTPTDALTSLEKAIDHTVSELARMGIRMLSPENSGESGVALEIRNSAQTSQLATLNVKVSQTMRQIIALMLRWKYGIDISVSDVDFNLSADFSPVPIGESWIRLVSEWYKEGIIPRSLFIEIAKQNDIIPTDYDDEQGREEIANDPTNPASQPQDMNFGEPLPGGF